MDDRCDICRATRGLNAQHRAAHEDKRVIPLLVAEYCFFLSDAATSARHELSR